MFGCASGGTCGACTGRCGVIGAGGGDLEGDGDGTGGGPSAAGAGAEGLALGGDEVQSFSRHRPVMSSCFSGNGIAFLLG